VRGSRRGKKISEKLRREEDEVDSESLRRNIRIFCPLKFSSSSSLSLRRVFLRCRDLFGVS
jgi:hypothetical protein